MPSSAKRQNNVSIFDHLDYRCFLEAVLDSARAEGASAREIARRCQLNSSNYLQLVITGKRGLTEATAVKIAEGIGLSGLERRFFLTLVAMDRSRSSGAKAKLLRDLYQIIDRARRKRIVDDSIHSSWLHAVVWVLLDTGRFELTAEEVKARLGDVAKIDEINRSIEFLRAKNFVVETEQPGIYRQNSLSFTVRQDIRRIDVIQKHAFFLEMAKHRLNDDVNEREFQNLTIAVPVEGMELIKSRIREFMASIHEDLLKLGPAQQVVHVQFAAFKVARSRDTSDGSAAGGGDRACAS